MFSTQVPLPPGQLWSGITLLDPCLVALSYLPLAGTFVNVAGQVKCQLDNSIDKDIYFDLS